MALRYTARQEESIGTTLVLGLRTSHEHVAKH